MALAVCGGLAAASLLFGTVVLVKSDSKPTTDAAGQTLTTPAETISAGSTSSDVAAPTSDLPAPGPGTTTQAPPVERTEASTEGSSPRHTTAPTRTQVQPPVSPESATSEPSEPTAATSSTKSPSKPAGITISAQAVSAGATVAVDFSATGQVHPTVTGEISAIGNNVDFGDGTSDSTNQSGANCDTASPTRSLDQGQTLGGSLMHTYKGSGIYTVTITVEYCGDSGPTSATTTRTITVA